MARTLTKDEISGLPVAERLDLISALWDSLAPGKVPLPESHRQLVDEALQEYNRNADGGEPWESVRDELFRKK